MDHQCLDNWLDVGAVTNEATVTVDSWTFSVLLRGLVVNNSRSSRNRTSPLITVCI